MKRLFALAAALLLIFAALLPLFIVETNGAEETIKSDPPVIADKLPGEDKPAEGCATLDIGEPIGEFTLTAYCPCSICCGKEDSITATGSLAAEGRTIAVDPSVIPYGSTVTIYFADGAMRTYIAEDCGGAIKGNRIDVFFNDHQSAQNFGIQTAYVYMEELNG